LPSDDRGRRLSDGSCGEEGPGVLSGNDSEMSLINLAPFHLGFNQTADGDL